MDKQTNILFEDSDGGAYSKTDIDLAYALGAGRMRQKIKSFILRQKFEPNQLMSSDNMRFNITMDLLAEGIEQIND